ncbi:MAG: HlyD family secretion protein [Acidobacteriota bacterium]
MTETKTPLWRSPTVLRWAALLSVLLVAVWWWWSRGRVATDNARLEGPVFPISARVEGNVEEVFVSLNQRVNAGQPLFRLDARDYEVALAQARADFAAAEAAAIVAQREVPVGATGARSDQTGARAAERNAATDVSVAERGLERARAQRLAATATLEQAQARAATSARDLERLEPLAEKQQISAQQIDSTRSAARSAAAAAQRAQAELVAAEEDVAIAEGSLRRARGELERARAQRAAADTAPQRVEAIEARAELATAELEAARAALERAEHDLADTTVRAPAAGVIGRKAIEPGQFVQRGEPLLALVGEDVWVEANYKETQLARLRVGQPVTVKVDAYRGKLEGHVESVGPATGSRFSLLPADNTSGNFVKVVQRVPVKILLDAAEAEPGALRPGMSVHTVVHLRARIDGE